MVSSVEKSRAKDAVIEWIDTILERKDWDGTRLAREAGLAPSTILRLLNDERHAFLPTLQTLEKIAKGANTDIPPSVLRALGGSRVAPAASDTEVDTPGRTAPGRVASPSPLAVRRPMLKVHTISALPEALHSKHDQEVLVPCPAQLEGDATAFAFYMPEATYEPWMKAGALCYASKRRDPVPGDMVMVTRKNGRSIVRLLVEMNEKGLALSKSNPSKVSETISFDDLKDVAVVMMISLQ